MNSSYSFQEVHSATDGPIQADFLEVGLNANQGVLIRLTNFFWPNSEVYEFRYGPDPVIEIRIRPDSL